MSESAISPINSGTSTIIDDTPNLPAIVSSTRSFLDIVQAWDSKENNAAANTRSVAARETEQHVQKFVRAFDAALDAAQKGHTAASEGLTMAEYVSNNDADQSKKDDYMEGMRQISREGVARSENALKGFREVKQGIVEALQRLKTPETEPECEVLEKNFSVLEDFEKLMGWYARWWTEKNMEERGQEHRITTNLEAKQQSHVRMHSVFVKFQTLKTEYEAYTDQMQKIQDNYPTIWRISVKTSPTIPPIDPEKNSPISSRRRTPDSPATTPTIPTTKPTDSSPDSGRQTGGPEDAHNSGCCCCIIM